jgi:hypothetical protein
MMKGPILIALAASWILACSSLEPWREPGDGDDAPDLDHDTVPDVPSDESADPAADPDALDAIDTLDSPSDTFTEPDVIPTCTVGDFVGQVMCGTGWKCTFNTVDTAGNPTPVCDVAGPRGWGESCTPSGLSDDCQAGYMCMRVRDDWRCRRFCSADATCRLPPGGPNAACELKMVALGTSIEVRDVTFCTYHCDPLTFPDGCPSGLACISRNPDGVWHTDCRVPGTGAQCAAGTLDDCPAHSGCFDMGTANECLPYCRYPLGEPSCTSPDTCHSRSDWPSWIGICY